MPAEPTSEEPEYRRGDIEGTGGSAATEFRAFTRQIAASSAESVVAEARGMSLLIAQDSAARRLSASQAAFWAAERTGDRCRREAAYGAMRAARAGFTRITNAAIEEMRGITEAEHTRLDELVAQLLRARTGALGGGHGGVARHPRHTVLPLPDGSVPASRDAASRTAPSRHRPEFEENAAEQAR